MSKEKENPEYEKAISSLIQNVLDFSRLSALDKDKPFEFVFSSKVEFDSEWKKRKNIECRDAALLNLVKTSKFIQNSQYIFSGFCDVCQKEQDFILEPVWSTGTEGLGCTECGCNSRLRSLYDTFLKHYKPERKVYINEMVTPFFRELKKVVPDLIGSEFVGEDIKSGTVVGSIRHEDSTKLSFEDNSFDLYLSNDVFEHAFDFRKAFAESSRILKKRGKMIFHIPFHLDQQETVIRAVKNKKNGIDYLLEPIYHGNPLSEEGSLCVQDFGWDLFSILKECGFKKSYGVCKNDIYKGYMNVTSLVFIAEK
jgi:hypothetical protein